MKTIPGYSGHAWEITRRDEQGRALAVRFALHKGGELSHQIRKSSRTPQDGAGPWHLRHWSGGSEHWQRVSPALPAPWTPDGIVAALRNALDALAAAAAGADKFAQLRARTQARTVATIGALGADWIALGMPDTAGRPRTAAQQARIRPFLTQALAWWGAHNPANVTQRQMRDYAHDRAATAASHGRGYSGHRAADLELVALSNCCAWAVADERIQFNPFAQRPRFRDPEDVEHCHLYQPQSDEELHQIAAHLLADPDTLVSGARYLFAAMTGLRPGETISLRWDAKLLGPGRAEPGYTFTDAAGIRRLVIRRLKNGINPAVEIHPALERFLTTWKAWCSENRPNNPWMFPNQSTGAHAGELMTRHVTAAAKALGLPERTGHAARAFYVSVRRSQGLDDATIASALGQRSGAGLVVSVYGDPGQFRGDKRLDWLPSDTKPAWESLTVSNVIPFAA